MSEKEKIHTIHELAGLGDYIVYITRDASDVYVNAVLRSQVEYVLKKYNVEYIEALYDNENVSWEEVEKLLDEGAKKIEHIDVLTY